MSKLTSTETGKYLNILAPIIDNEMVFVVSKCGCSSIAKIACDRLIDDPSYKNTYCDIDLPFPGWYYFHKCKIKFNLDIKKNNTITAIIRDPLERLVSSYNTIGKSFDFIEYLKKVDDVLTNNDWINIDRHITLQSIHYNFNSVDRFVWLMDLPSFINSLGIEDYKLINRSNNIYTVSDIPVDLRDKFIDHYKIDYEMINSIPENKLYKP